MNNTETIQDLINSTRTAVIFIHYLYGSMQNGLDEFIADFDKEGNV